MDLAHPWGLLALLGIPLVILLHRRAARARRVVALVALWRPAAARATRGARPLRDPLLLVRLLLVIAVAAALAQPGWRGAASLRHVLVLDASASMNARAGQTTRFREAQDEALRVLAALDAGGEIMVVGGGPPPTVALAWSSDPRSVSATLAGLAAGAAPKDLRAALALARRGLDGRPGLVHLFSDYGGDPAPLARAAGLAPDQLRAHPVGAPAENLAIVRAAVAPLVESPLDHQVLALVANFADVDRSVDLALVLPDGRRERRRLLLAPGQRTPALFTVPAADWVELRLEGPADALAIDDRVTLVPSPPRLRVVHVGGADPFVAAALRAHPGLALTRVAPERLHAEAWAAGADVAVVEGGALPPGFAVPALVLGAPAPPRARPARVASWERQHPLLGGTDLRDVVVPAGRTLTSGPGETLISSAEGPVATATLHGARRRVELSFAVADSTLGATPAFPVLVTRSLEWLAERGSAGASLEPGQALEMPLPDPVPSGVTVRRPDGSVVAARVERGRLRFTQTELTGRYVVTGPGIHFAFSVNLLNADESDVRRPPGRPRDPGPATSAPADGTVGDRWTAVRIALALALQLFSLEIWLLQRRAGRRPA